MLKKTNLIELNFIFSILFIYFNLVSVFLSSLFLVLWVLTSIFIVYKFKTYHLTTSSWSFFCLYFIILIYAFSFNLLEKENTMIFKLVPFLLIPFALSVFSTENKKLLKLCYAFIFSVATVILISIINIFYIAILNNSIPNFYNDGLFKESLYIHRPILGFFICISIVLSSYLITNNIRRKLNLFNIIFLYCFLIFIISKLAIILSSIYLVIFWIYFIKNKKIKYLSLVIYFLLFITIISNYEGLQKRFNNIKQDNRSYIYTCVKEIIDYPDFDYIFGFGGINNSQLNLENCYKSNENSSIRFIWARDLKLNTHNQFLGIYLALGVLGLTFFCIPFIQNLYLSIIYKNYVIFSILILLITFALLENVLMRQWTLYIYIYLLSIFNVILKKTKNV